MRKLFPVVPRLLRCLVSVAPLLSCGCVFLWQGSTQEVTFTSDPPGAWVHVGGRTDKTPCTLSIERLGAPVEISADAPGRVTYRGRIEPSLMAWYKFAGPFVVDAAFIIPLSIDMAYDCIYEWPEAVHLEMPPEGQGPANAEFFAESPPVVQTAP